ncbi:MAG TPA: FG-GAP-like repeat-containing protein [Gemmatimonadales bacterium]|nr:FG-GAP-like repeat-containing protein [Gemmatimonadales bacterium]
MLGSGTRRHRRLTLAAASAIGFVAVALAVALFALKPQPTYRPGQPVEGLTSELSRPLPRDYPRVTFVDVSREAGITFQHFWRQRTSQIAEDMGSGAAWGDYDNDGWPDLFLMNVAGPVTLRADSLQRSPAGCALYRNNRDGTFTDVSAQAGVDLRIWGMGAEWGDYDNDGRLDLAVSAYGANVLFRNNGNGTFTNVSNRSGIGKPRGFWSGVAWGDYDRDGFLDLYVTGYVRYTPPDPGAAVWTPQMDEENPASINPSAYPPERNLLFHNNRDGTFTEVAAAAGVLGHKGKSLEAAWADFDGDGWRDLYVANDVTDNQLFRNLGNGTFADISHQAHVADYRSAMGLAVGDWDGDQDQDIFITHWIAQENALYSNLGTTPLDFRDEADRFGVGQIALDFVGWGTFFFDYDNDGRLDVFVANGHTFQRRDAPRLLAPQTAQLFWNHGSSDGLYDVSAVSGAYFAAPRVGRGAAFADYDNDGDLDVVVINHAGAAALLRNDGGNRNHWLKVRVEGRAAGARIRVVADTLVAVREVGAQSSYLSQNDPTEHFGLAARKQVDSVVITWPDGKREALTHVAADQTVRAGARATTGKAAIQEFWSRYREATAARVAGQPARARDAYARALALDPRHEDVLYYLGNMELELGDYAGAETAWQQLIQVNPGSARAHSRLGDLYACPDSGAPWDLRRAESEFARASELNREETGPLLRLGEVAVLQGDWTRALHYFDAVIGSHSGSVEAHFLKGYVAWKRAQQDVAQAQYRAAEALMRAAEPPQQAPLEGDTKLGTAPLVSRPTRCLLFGNLLEPYAQLDGRVKQALSAPRLR